ncbi:acyl transferase 15-like [Lolium rigidum]|uniref:acyl transferase 15-like n=1 Tax=Lolium rigidum TaxID=89674 RepID=UPI001F5CFCFC|nr:acyl transferase 15-like [Lolium rigidum]
MSVVVTKSSPVVVVGASKPVTATGDIIDLTSFDKCFAPSPTTLIFFFEKPIDDPVETIKKALSQALVHYPAMAGRLAGADEKEPTHIVCTGEGVPFVAAAASCALDDAGPLHLLDLAIRYPAEYCRLSDPLLLMQVTRFTCGGFVVGLTNNHAMADAAGLAQFMQAVGELARGMPRPSIVPVRSEADSSLPRLPQALVAEVRSHLRVEKEEILPLLDVAIPMSLASRIKAKCGAGKCTVYDAVAAVLWRCRTRAVISDEDNDPNAPMLLVMPMNARKLVGAKEGYYGNCIIFQLALATRDTVATGDIEDLVKIIRLAKEKMPDMVGDGRDEQQQAQRAPERYNTLSISSVRNLGYEVMDFGGGVPSRMMWKTAEKPVGLVCVVCSPCKPKDMINVMSLCVKPEHTEAFLRELAALNVEVTHDLRPSYKARL